MKVVYDITLLGQAFEKSGFERAGIFRTVHSLLQSLAARPDCDLLLTSVQGTQRWTDFYRSLRWWESDPSLRNLPFLHTAWQRLVAAASAKTRRPKLKRLLSVLLSASDPIAQRTYAEADIFHGNYYGLQNVRGHMARFLTVHDLIPLILPAVQESRSIERFRATLDSIRPDDWIICPSQSTKDDLCQYTQISAERIFVTPWGADPSIFAPVSERAVVQSTLAKYGISEPYLMSLCTIEPRKNIDRLIRCFRTLVETEKLDSLHLVLVGPAGWMMEGVQAALDQLPEALRSRVLMPGFIDDLDLSAIYSGALAFVYPSLYEGFGLPILEAMYCGTPVITSNVSSMPEVVGAAGITVNPTDDDQICQSLLDVYNSQPLRARLSEQGLERAKRFTWDACADATVAAYRQAL